MYSIYIYLFIHALHNTYFLNVYMIFIDIGLGRGGRTDQQINRSIYHSSLTVIAESINIKLYQLAQTKL